MALTFKSFLGGGPAKAHGEVDTELDEPTTQVKLGGERGYNPLASASIMDQMRNATPESNHPSRLAFIGHLPIVRQFQLLGSLLIVFLLLALFMLYLDSRL